MKQIVKIGIMNKQDYVKRTIAIAKGQYKPAPNEPKIWFESMQSMAQVLSAENQQLLRIIEEKKPDSVTELETLSDRKKSNLSRTLKAFERYGIVRLEQTSGRKKKPVVLATDFEVSFGLNTGFANSNFA
ncbi:transcriptional regulator [Thiomicrorhabdus sp.]|uniref:HVO_A0114 family putative DNA-binding protein n=1 Tax=Thiomicrorhabdus sp. TaxID=2039724 RepID=UPI0029C9245F|nr:transcriptional regulator [Thiomicrorhabdus sp.]